MIRKVTPFLTLAACLAASAFAEDARYVRVELPGKNRILTLAEVEVIIGGKNIDPKGKATHSSTSARAVASKSIDVNKIFRPAKERIPFPVGTRVYRRQYSMNPWQEDFVRTLMAETEWRGGLFDVQPGNVRTNLSEGAVGYFSVSQVVADTTIITP